jgi:hypothetical protein
MIMCVSPGGFFEGGGAVVKDLFFMVIQLIPGVLDGWYMTMPISEKR